MAVEEREVILKRLRENSDLYLGIQSHATPSRYLHGTSKKAEAKKEAQEHKKKAKRQKLDPSAPRTTTEIQKDLIEKEKEATTDENLTSTATEINPMEQSEKGRAASIEELRERLQNKLAAMRASRKAQESAEKAKQALKWQNSKKGKNTKRGGETEPPKATDKVIAKEKPTEKAAVNDSTNLELSFQYGKIDGDKGALNKKKKVKKPKTSQLLAKAAALQAVLSKASEAGEEEKVNKHAWSAAVGRASGKKVLDDPKLLKRTLQREKSQRKKSSKTWGERKSQQNAATFAKQKKRKEHLQERVEKKKQTKIAKREKKLMRPGFEGRVGSIINKPSE